VDGGNRNAVRVGSEEFQKTLLNRNHPRLSKRGDEEVFGLRVGFREDIRGTAGDDLGFSGSGTGDNHYRTIEGFGSFALRGIKTLEGFFEIKVGRHWEFFTVRREYSAESGGFKAENEELRA
jgi:hypothetical protein